MPAPLQPIARRIVEDGYRHYAALGLVILAALAAYTNTGQVPFLLDDYIAIQSNASLRSDSTWGQVLAPWASTVSGRPLLNLSYALNYAWSGDNPWGYHVVNTIIHAASAALLFGIVRATLTLKQFDQRYYSPTSVAALTAAVWALHPLHTQAVTYISQRAESMMGAWLLATLYCYIRGRRSPVSRHWLGCSIACCFMGMATKETMVTAPVVVLVYDRAFLSESLWGALRLRPRYYAGLASSWALLAVLMAYFRHDASVGFDRGVGPLQYAVTQCYVVVQYIKLAFWPYPLVFDYGPEILFSRYAAALPYALMLGVALSLTVLAWRKSRGAGFLAAAFFILLAPTSSVVPISMQPMAESRMYLPCAAAVAGLAVTIGKCAPRFAVGILGAAAIALAAQTWQRNLVFQSAVTLWEDTSRKRPRSARVQNNLGDALIEAGRPSEALQPLQAALQIDPAYAEAHFNLGRCFALHPNKRDDAVSSFTRALYFRPAYPEAHAHLGQVLLHLGRPAEAGTHFEAALRLTPGVAELHYNLGQLLQEQPNRLPDAITRYREAIRLKPNFAEAHNNLALALVQAGQIHDAFPHLERAAALNAAYRGNLELVKANLASPK